MWVVGLGNVLAGDDGLGPTVVRTFDALWEVPPGVALLDAGTPGMDLISHIRGAEALVVVDTVVASGAPGTLVLRRRDELLRAPLLPRVNPHAPGLRETLLTLDLLGDAPRDVLLVGVVPDRTDVGIGLSAPARRAVPEAVRTVARELTELGWPPARRPHPPEPDLWWERGRNRRGLEAAVAPSPGIPPS